MREVPQALVICMASCVALVKSLPLSELGIAHSLKQSSKPSRDERTIWETEAIRQSYAKLGIHKLRPSQAHSPVCQLGAGSANLPSLPWGHLGMEIPPLAKHWVPTIQRRSWGGQTPDSHTLCPLPTRTRKGCRFQPASRELILWVSFTHLFIHSTNVYWAPAMYPSQS